MLLPYLVRETGIEPVWLPTRPSTVRVCQFRHSRENSSIIAKENRFVKGFFEEKTDFFRAREKRRRKEETG